MSRECRLDGVALGASILIQFHDNGPSTHIQRADAGVGGPWSKERDQAGASLLIRSILDPDFHVTKTMLCSSPCARIHACERHHQVKVDLVHGACVELGGRSLDRPDAVVSFVISGEDIAFRMTKLDRFRIVGHERWPGHRDAASNHQRNGNATVSYGSGPMRVHSFRPAIAESAPGCNGCAGSIIADGALATSTQALDAGTAPRVVGVRSERQTLEDGAGDVRKQRPHVDGFRRQAYVRAEFRPFAARRSPRTEVSARPPATPPLPGRTRSAVNPA